MYYAYASNKLLEYLFHGHWSRLSCCFIIQYYSVFQDFCENTKVMLYDKSIYSSFNYSYKRIVYIYVMQ